MRLNDTIGTSWRRGLNNSGRNMCQEITMQSSLQTAIWICVFRSEGQASMQFAAQARIVQVIR